MSLIENDNQDAQLRDSLLVDEIMATTAADNTRAFRFRTIAKMNPYMAMNPQAIATMANMPIPTAQLMSQAGALYGMQVGSGLASQLRDYDPSMQRSIYGQLTPAQQATVRAYGYEYPEEDVNGSGLFGKIISVAAWPAAKVFGGIGRTVAPAFGPTFDALYNVGETGMKVYRTIKQLDDATQWMSLAAGLVTAGSIALAPVTGGSSLAVTALLTAGRLGLAASVGTAAAAATSFVASSILNGGTSTWLNAWSNAYDGERLFTESGIKKASELLGMDSNLLSLAQELADESEFPGDLLSIAREIAGVRDSTNPKTRTDQLQRVAEKYATPGTPAFENAYELISTMLTIPAFSEALTVLEKSKISMGRDIVRLFGGDPSSGWGRTLSGGFDLVSIFLIDPFLLAGKAARAAAMTRRGIQFVDTVNYHERFRQIAQLPEMQRKLQVVADAVNAGDVSLLNRGARDYRPLFDLLVMNKRQIAAETFTPNNVVDFIVGTDKLKSVMKGVGVVPGASYGQLRGLNRGQYAWAQATGAARDALRGIADVRIENVRLPKIARDIRNASVSNLARSSVDELKQFGLSDNAADLVANFFSNLHARTIIDEIPEALKEADSVNALDLWDQLDNYSEATVREAKSFLTDSLSNSRDAYRVGRTIGNMPFIGTVLSPFANFVEGITTRIPGGAIKITGLEAPDDIRNFVELFRYVGMPSYARNAWTNAILFGDTPGVRLNSILALIDSAATASGMRLTKSGTDLLDEFLEKTKQIYGLGQSSRYSLGFMSNAFTPRAFRPVADMADMIAIPDLREMRKAVRQGMVMRALLGVSENTAVLAAQNRFWKPAVLLRVGFVVRNVGEEMLSMLTRYGIGSWSQEFLGRQVAQREEFFRAEAASRKLNQQSALSAYDSHVIRSRYDVPPPLRPLARAIERIPDGQPWQKVLRSYSKYIVDFSGRANASIQGLLLHGFGGQALRRGAAKFSGTAVEETARGRLNNIVARLAFGNQYSLRRMVIGGLNETLLDDMRAFEGIYLKSIMDTVGTSNLAPWDRTGLRQKGVQALLVDENSKQQVQLVQVLGERGLSTRANNLPNQQPFHEANLESIQGLIEDDPIIAKAMEPMRLVYDTDIEAALPATQLIPALKSFGEFAASGNKWDDDLLQLWTILNAGTPRPDRLQALLQRMTIPQSKLDEFAKSSSDLYRWAVERNALVQTIREAYPGQNMPSFGELVSILRSKHDDVLQMEFAQRQAEIEQIKIDMKEWGSYRAPGGAESDKIVIDVTDVDQTLLDYKYGYTRLADQLAVLERMDAAISGAKPYGRDWFNQLLMAWHNNPELLHLPSVLNMSSSAARVRPTFWAYRGMTYDDLLDVDENGDLIMRLTPRDWTRDNPSISFSLNEFQAKKYVKAQVGSGSVPEGAEKIETLFVVNGDALVNSIGRDISDVNGVEYAIPSEANRDLMGGEFFPHMVNPPKFPFEAPGDEFNLHRREFAITHVTDQQYADTRLYSIENEVKNNLFNSLERLFPAAQAQEFAYLSDVELYGQEIVDQINEGLKLLDPRGLALQGIDLGASGLSDQFVDIIASEFKLAAGQTTNPTINNAVDVATEVFKKQSRGNYATVNTLPGDGLGEDIISYGMTDLRVAHLNGADTDTMTELIKRVFPDVDFGNIKYETIDNLVEAMQKLHRFSTDGVLYARSSGPTIRIPKGSWSAISDPLSTTKPGSKLDRLRQNSTDQNYWPFFGSYDDAKNAMRLSGAQETATGQFDELLKKNAEWHGVPKTVDAFIVDTRPLNLGARDVQVYKGADNQVWGDFDLTGADDNLIRSIINRHLSLKPKTSKQPNLEAEELLNPIMASIAEQQPLVVGDRVTAELMGDIIEDYVKTKTGRVSERPLIAVTSLPAENPEAFGKPWTSFPLRGTSSSGKKINTVLYGSTSERINIGTRYNWLSPTPFVWDWLDQIAQAPGPQNIIDNMMELIDQRVRAGRRLQVFTNDGPNARPVYRNVNGEAVALEPGELVNPNERYYADTRLTLKNQIAPGDQRYFQMGELSYEGSSDLLWPVLGPVLLDATEADMGLRLYDLKAPVDMPTIGGRRERIYTQRDRIRYATTEHVVNTPAGDLPDWEIVQLYKPIKQNVWDRAVQFGFNNVIGPTIDAITRKPMAAHAFHIAAERNRNMTRWLINSSKEEQLLRTAITQIESRMPDAVINPDQLSIWSDLGRAIGEVYGVENASQWDNMMSLAFLRGFSPGEFDDAVRIMNEGYQAISNDVSPLIDAFYRKYPKPSFFIPENFIGGTVPYSSLIDDVTSALSKKGKDYEEVSGIVDMFVEQGRLLGIASGVDISNRVNRLAAEELIDLGEAWWEAARKTLGEKTGRIETPASSFWAGVRDSSKPEMVRLKASLDYAVNKFDELHSSVSDRTGNVFLSELDRLFGKGTALKGEKTISNTEWNELPAQARTLYEAITPDEWAAIQKSAQQRANYADEVYEYAAEHTIRDIMPYVDSHEVRSQFADSMSSFLPFWYAEENFLKRWGKIFSEGGPAVSLERIRKLQLTYQGLKNVGIVRTDAQGQDYFVYPGSELFFDAVDRVFPGKRLPLDALIQTQTAKMIPSFNRDFGRPSLTPFAAVSLDLVTALFPEARTFEEALIGKEYVFGNVVDAIVPRHISNVWQSLGDIFDTDLNPNNQRVASAMMAAMAHMEANDQGLPDNATAEQRDDYLRRVRSHARIIIFSQALAGFFTAGPAQMIQIPDGGSLDWITDGALTNPAELLQSQYYELISNLGIEKGTQQFLAINKNAGINSVVKPLAYTVARTASKSGAPLASTEQAYNFYSDNKEFFDQYSMAGPWLLPQLEDNETRSQYAFNSELADGFRERRTPDEFITMIKYKEGATQYFATKELYEREDKKLRASGNPEAARTLNREWLLWAESFKATHPLFAEMLTSDESRKRRQSVMSQMRYLIKDPLAPKAKHFEALASLQRSFDAYSVARSELGLDRTSRGVNTLNALKASFKEWVDDFIVANPSLSSYWITILQPESGLD